MSSYVLLLLCPLASWHDAGDTGASHWRCAHRGSSQHVFHQAACASIYTHLCLSSYSCDYHATQFSLKSFSINSRDHFSERGAFLCRISSQKLEINWTGLTNLLDIPGLK